MGYNRWRHRVFYFSSMVAVGGDMLAVTSSTSAYSRHLIDIRGSFFLCLHGAATHASNVDGAVADSRGTVQHGGIEGSNNAHVAMLPDKPAWSKSGLFLELYWSGQLRNHALA